MPAPVFKGSFPVLISESTSQTNDGAYQYVRTRTYTLAGVVTPTIGASFSYEGQTLSLTSFSISRKDGLATLTETYTGSDTTTPDVYEVSASTADEPIASHPAFTSSTGIYATSIVDASGGAITQGTSGSGGAIFNEDGSFVGFSKNANNNFFGIQSFLSPRVAYKRIYSKTSAPTSAEQVAYIYATPLGSPPAIPSGRNWILSGVSWQNNGNKNTNSGQYQITEEYLSSGPSGWNNTIYYTA